MLWTTGENVPYTLVLFQTTVNCASCFALRATENSNNSGFRRTCYPGCRKILRFREVSTFLLLPTSHNVRYGHGDIIDTEKNIGRKNC